MVPWRKIIKEINTFDKPVLAVSGGVDSVFLFDFYFRNYKSPFAVAHFNHDIRPTAGRDETFVRDLARSGEDQKVKFYVGYGNPEKIKAAPSIEAECRAQRYKFLNQVKDDFGATCIVTAHHLNDQIETILLRLMRGLPHSNLIMEAFSGDKIYRPFLQVPKQDIVDHCENRGLKWVEDETNYDNKYERNWLRNEIIPLLMVRRNLLKSMAKGYNYGVTPTRKN